MLQGDLDRQRLLGNRQRSGVYESALEDGVEGIEHQERWVPQRSPSIKSIIMQFSAYVENDSSRFRISICHVNGRICSLRSPAVIDVRLFDSQQQQQQPTEPNSRVCGFVRWMDKQYN